MRPDTKCIHGKIVAEPCLDCDYPEQAALFKRVSDELDCARSDLAKALVSHDRLVASLKKIAYTDEGHKVVGVSRNGAIRAFNRAVFIARLALEGLGKQEGTKV